MPVKLMQHELLFSSCTQYYCKNKRKSNLENYNFLFCFATSVFYYVILFEPPKPDSILIDTKNVCVLFIKNN